MTPSPYYYLDLYQGEPSVEPETCSLGRLFVELKTDVDGLSLHYTWDGTNPDQTYPRYQQPLSPPPGASELRAISYHNGRPVGREVRITLTELTKRASAALS